MPCSPPNEELPMQSYGISQQCGDFQATSLQSTRFERAIIGSGQIFGIVKEFHDAIYLMSLVGRFHYKFKGNSPQHTIVICNAETCPWKIIACAIDATRVVQVHTFRNIHNHFVHDALFS